MFSDYDTGCETYPPNTLMASCIYYSVPIFTFPLSVSLVSVPPKLNLFPLCIIIQPNCFDSDDKISSFTLVSTCKTLLPSTYHHSLHILHLPYYLLHICRMGPIKNTHPSLYFCVVHTIL